MSPTAKITVLIIGSLGVGLTAYYLMRKRQVAIPTTPDMSAPDATVVQNPVTQAKKASLCYDDRILYTDDPAAVLESDDDGDVWHLPDLAVYPPSELASSDSTTSETAADAIVPYVSPTDAGIIPLLPGKTISIYGLEYSCTSNNYVFVDGVHMDVGACINHHDRQATQKIHTQLSRKIDRIRSETRLVKNRIEKTIITDMMIKTRVAPGFQVLVEFTPKSPWVMTGIQAVFLMVDGEGLVIPSSYMNRPREAWLADMRVIFCHFLHALGDSGKLPSDLKDQMFHHMCNHFALLGSKLFTDTLANRET